MVYNNTIFIKGDGVFMLPKEICEILNKYEQDNENNIININNSIDSMIIAFENINLSIANQLRKSVIDKNINNNAEDLLKDSVIIRTFINSLTPINIKNQVEDNHNMEIAEEFNPIIFGKKVYSYLVSDDICPFCNVKLQEHIIYYQRIINGQLADETVEWNKCPNCNNLFVLDYDAENFDFNNTNVTLNKDKYDNIPQIDIYSVVVLSHTIHCSMNHNSKDIIAKLPVLNEYGQISYLKINASYCFTCNRFTILKDDFNAIKDVIMCKIIDETSEEQTNVDYDIEIEQNKSILFQYGYNVQTKKNLSEQQRHIILSSVIEANIVNRRDVINHINTLIERGSKISSWKEATQKWKDDKKFVSEYQSDTLPEVIFNNIILKYRKYSK